MPNNPDGNMTTYSPMPTTIIEGGNTYHVKGKHPMQAYTGRGGFYI
jgi:hypothetical protein